APTVTQRIYFANHTSHLDFILLWAVLPVPLRQITRPVAASDYWNRTVVRRHLIHRVFHGVLVDRVRVRRQNDPIAAMCEALEKGASLSWFPEGTRGLGEKLQVFKSGIYHLATRRPEVELVPVWIDNGYRVLPKGMLLPVPLLCSVAFGVPVRLGSSEG